MTIRTKKRFGGRNFRPQNSTRRPHHRKKLAHAAPTEWQDGRPIVRGRLIQRHPVLEHSGFLEVICPLCRKLHWHAWDLRDGFDVAAHRVAHCVGTRVPQQMKSIGYFVALDANAVHNV